MLRYLGPTMGKTTAAKDNPNLIDFDQLIKEDIKKAASNYNIPVRMYKTLGLPCYRKLIYNNLIKASVMYPDKIVMVSNTIALEFHMLFEGEFLIPSFTEFVKRNVNRGGGYTESVIWYQILMIKGKGLLRIENQFISDLLSF